MNSPGKRARKKSSPTVLHATSSTNSLKSLVSVSPSPTSSVQKSVEDEQEDNKNVKELLATDIKSNRPRNSFRIINTTADELVRTIKLRRESSVNLGQSNHNPKETKKQEKQMRTEMSVVRRNMSISGSLASVSSDIHSSSRRSSILATAIKNHHDTITETHLNDGLDNSLSSPAPEVDSDEEHENALTRDYFHNMEIRTMTTTIRVLKMDLENILQTTRDTCKLFKMEINYDSPTVEIISRLKNLKNVIEKFADLENFDVSEYRQKFMAEIEKLQRRNSSLESQITKLEERIEECGELEQRLHHELRYSQAQAEEVRRLKDLEMGEYREKVNQLENALMQLKEEKRLVQEKEEAQRAEILKIPKREEILLKETRDLLRRKDVEIVFLEKRQKNLELEYRELGYWKSKAEEHELEAQHLHDVVRSLQRQMIMHEKYDDHRHRNGNGHDDHDMGPSSTQHINKSKSNNPKQKPQQQRPSSSMRKDVTSPDRLSSSEKLQAKASTGIQNTTPVSTVKPTSRSRPSSAPIVPRNNQTNSTFFISNATLKRNMTQASSIQGPSTAPSSPTSSTPPAVIVEGDETRENPDEQAEEMYSPEDFKLSSYPLLNYVNKMLKSSMNDEQKKGLYNKVKTLVEKCEKLQKEVTTLRQRLAQTRAYPVLGGRFSSDPIVRSGKLGSGKLFSSTGKINEVTSSSSPANETSKKGKSPQDISAEVSRLLKSSSSDSQSMSHNDGSDDEKGEEEAGGRGMTTGTSRASLLFEDRRRASLMKRSLLTREGVNVNAIRSSRSFNIDVLEKTVNR